jgi:hypothetical protein
MAGRLLTGVHADPAQELTTSLAEDRTEFERSLPVRFMAGSPTCLAGGQGRTFGLDGSGSERPKTLQEHRDELERLLWVSTQQPPIRCTLDEEEWS